MGPTMTDLHKIRPAARVYSAHQGTRPCLKPWESYAFVFEFPAQQGTHHCLQGQETCAPFFKVSSIAGDASLPPSPCNANVKARTGKAHTHTPLALWLAVPVKLIPRQHTQPCLHCSSSCGSWTERLGCRRQKSRSYSVTLTRSSGYQMSSWHDAEQVLAWSVHVHLEQVSGQWQGVVSGQWKVSGQAWSVHVHLEQVGACTP
eukprot:1136551-Pelagomonas_calceolata.AAC.8